MRNIDPTHRCGHTIDLFITRHDDLLIMKYFIDRSNFTKDHYRINCVLDLPKPLASKVTHTIRKYKLIYHESFSKDLAARMHDIAYHEYDNINDLSADYNKACSEVLDSHAPRSTSVKHRPAWYGESVDTARRERRRCERRWRKLRSDASREKYHASKQNVNDLIRESKTEYYKDRLNNCSVKDMYKTVNELLNKTNKAIPNTDCPEDLVNDFSRFFIGKVNKIRNEVDGMVFSSSSSSSSKVVLEIVPCCM